MTWAREGKPGRGSTVKGKPLLATPATVTVTLPVEAPPGTVAIIVDPLQLVTGAAVPLNATVLFPWSAPKFAPEIVTSVSIGPPGKLRAVMCGGCATLPAGSKAAPRNKIPARDL
jgi:hypothetical protein